MFSVLQEFDHARAHEFPDCVANLTIIDMDTGKEFDRAAVEVHAVEGWAEVYVEPRNPDSPEWETEIVKGNFRIVLIE